MHKYDMDNRQPLSDEDEDEDEEESFEDDTSTIAK